MDENFKIGTIGHMMQVLGKFPKAVEKKQCGTIPTHCDLCHRQLKNQFVDGRTQMGPWALMCAACHSRKGVGLGLGKGQRYDLVSLEKIAG